MRLNTYGAEEIDSIPGLDVGDAEEVSSSLDIGDAEEDSGPLGAIYKTAVNRGVNPDFLIGLAKLETRMGEATIKGDSDSYNLFNIKDITGKGPRATDKAEGSRDAYRQYASYDDSTNDLVDMLARKYPKALEAQTPEQFATALKQGGYATDPDYVNKVVRTIKSVNRYDDQPATDDAPEGMPNHVNLRALDAQMAERSTQAAPPAKAPAERTWREAATDTARSLTQGAIDVVGVLPGAAWAATPWGSYDNAWLNTARGMNEVIQDQKSDEIKARRVEMDKKLSHAEGFTQKIVAGFVEGLADPTLLADTLARSAPGMVAGGFAGKAAGTAADALGMTVLKNAATQSGVISQGLTVASAAPRVAGATAVGTSAIVQGSSVASDTYEEAMKRPMSDFRALPEFEQLAQEHGEEQAKSILAGKAATRAGMVATAASLVAQKAIPGGDSIEKMFLPSTMREVADTVAKTGSSVLTKPVTKGMAGGAASQAAELALQGTKTGLKEGASEGFEETAGKVVQDLEMSRVGKDVNLSDTVASTFGQAAAVGMAAGNVSGMRETYATKSESIAAEGARLREMAAKRQADITSAGTVDEAIKAATDAQDYTSQSIANQILQLEGKQEAPTRTATEFTSQPQQTKLGAEATTLDAGPTFNASNIESLINGTQADQAIQSKPQEAPTETAGIKAEAAAIEQQQAKAQSQAAQDAGIRAEVSRMREIMEARRQAAQPPTDTAPTSQSGAVVSDLPNTSAAKQTTETTGVPVVETPVKDLKLSTDVPQFKSDAGSNGVVDKLDGKYDRALAAPIQVWQRTDGSMEVISGRHRLDLAQRSGEQTVPVQVHREADGFTAAHATLLDTELNVKDGRGKVKDYVRYFQSIPIERGEATQRGLLQTAIGRDAYTIANAGSDELIASHNASQLTDQAATQIAQAAPKNGALQAVGMRMVLDGKSTTQAVNTMAAVKLMAQERGGAETEDMFGFDDSSMRDAQAMAKIAGQEQAKVSNTLAAVRGAAKRPELAAKEGVNINDQAALAGRIQSLEKQKSEWSNWATNPELVAQIRSQMEPKSQSQPATTPASNAPTGAPVSPATESAPEIGIPGAVWSRGNGRIAGHYAVKVDGEVVGNYHEKPEAAVAEAKTFLANKEARAKDAANKDAAIGEIRTRLMDGGNATDNDIRRLGLRDGSSELKWFIPAAANAFGITSRAVRPYIKDLIRVGHTDMGTKIESVNPKKALQAIAAAIKPTQKSSTGTITEPAFDLTPTTPEQVKADEDRAASAVKAEAMAKQNADNKAQADAEVDDFRLTGSDRAVDVAEAAGQGSLFDSPTIEAAHAHIDSDATLNTLEKAKARAALRKGDIEPGDILPKAQESTSAPTQEVNNVDQNQGAMFSKGGRSADGSTGGVVFSDIRPPKESVNSVARSLSSSTKVLGNKTVSIETLIGGVGKEVNDLKRVQSLAEKLSKPDAYIERLIVDDAGNVIEGQHRLDALKLLGVKDVPVVVIQDFERNFPTEKVKSAIAEAQKIPSDHVTQLSAHLAEIYADEKGNIAEMRQYEAPVGLKKAWEAGIAAIEKSSNESTTPDISRSATASTPTEPPLTTRQTVRDAIAESLPKQARAIDRMIQRGEEGKRGGMVVIESNTPEAIAKAYSEKTGRDYDAALVQVQKSADGKIQGFHDPQSGLSFVVAPNVTAKTAAAVALHEAYHGQQREAIDTKAQALLDSADDKLHTTATRSVLAEARQKIYDAKETGNKGEAAAYIIEAAAQRGREAGFSAVDGKFMDWVDKNIGARVGGIIRDFVSMVRAHSLRIGLPINLHVDDLVAYAKIGLERAADGKTVAGDDVRSSFAGRKAATADTNAMQTAQERIKSGDDAETVRNETGWFKGVDGKMRFEINDKDAKLIVKQGDYVGIDAKKNEAGTWGVVKLGALLDHPALFAAYPSLKDMDVTLKSYGGGGGHYGTDGSIILNGAIAKRPIATATDGPFPVSKADADAINAEEAKLGDWRLKDKGTTLSVLLHEIQHGIQHIEGFASGGSYKQFEQKQTAALPLETVSRAIDIQEFASKNNLSVQQVKDSPPRYLRNVGADAWQLASSRNKASLEAEYEFSKRADDPHGSYHRLAGEVEARNVQTRQKFTDEERSLMPAYTTQDVPDWDVIVMFNGKEMHSAPPPANTPPVQQQPAAPASPSWDYKGSKADKLIYELQDGRIDLKRVQESIKKSGQDIDEKFDARLAETLYAGRVATRTDRFLQDDAAPLLEQMARTKVTMPELSDYLLARHAPERNAQIAKVNDKMPDGGAGTNSQGVRMTTQAANDYIANLPTETRLKMEKLAEKVDAITKGTRDLLVAEGLEKQETIDAWNAAYKHYAPLFREDVDDGRPHSVGTGFSVRGDSSKRATGSDKKVDNMLAHVLMQREAAITRAEKNRVAMSLYGLALSSPNKDFWTTIKPGVTDAQVEKLFADMGIDYDALPHGMKKLVKTEAKTEIRKQELDSIGVDRDKESNMSLAPTVTKIDRVTGKVVHVTNPLYKSLPGAITVRVNGEDRVLMFNQKDENALRLAESLKNLDGLTKFDLAGTIVGKTTRWMAAANTQYNPAFGLVNSTRDSLGALVNLSTTPLAGKQLKVFASMPSATAGIYSALRGDTSGQWAKLYEQFQMDGAQTGYKEMFKDVDARAKAIEKELAGYDKGALSPGKAAHAVLSVLDGFNTIGENVVRLSAYKTALDNGMSRPEAAKLARELTVDFNRKGRMGRELGPLYAFFNASVQGTARTIESLTGPAGAKIIAGGVGLGVLQAVMLAAAGYDDDEVADWVKSRNFIIPLGKTESGEKKHIQIPLPLGLNALPNIGRTIYELKQSGGKDFGKKTVSAIGEVMASLNPVGGGTVFTPEGGVDWGGVVKTAVPTILDPVVELATNKGFNGTAIEKTYRDEADSRPGFQRAKEKTKRTPTGQMYIGLTKALNRVTGGDDYEAGFISPSPEKARYLAEAIGGGLLREIEKAVDLSMKVPGQKETKVSGIPFIGRFYGETDSDAVAQSRYYKSADKAKSAESSINLAKAAGDGEAMRKIYEKRPEAKTIPLMNRVQPKLAKLNKLAVSQINDSKNIKLIDDARLEWMKATNKAILELEAQ